MKKEKRNENKKKNSLQFLTFIIIAVTFVGLLIAVLLVSQVQVMGGFTAVEQQSMVDEVNRSLIVIQDQTGRLDTVAQAWAGSEDTRSILTSPASSAILARYPDEKFSSTKVNVLVILDASGHVIAHKYFSLESSQQLPTPRSLLNQVEELPVSALGQRSGILNLESGPMLIAVRPVKNPDGNTTTGYVFIGRNLDTTMLGEISNVLGLQVTIHRAGPGSMPQGSSTSQMENGDTTITPVSDSIIAGYHILTDIRGSPSYFIEVSSPRPIHQYGQASLNYILLSLLIVGIIFEAVILILLEYSVISRITGLNREVQEIGAHGNPKERVTPRGNDEITSLAQSVNMMLSSLDLSREKLSESESRYANLLNNANDCIFSINSEGILLSYNRRLRHFADTLQARLFVGQPLAFITSCGTREDFKTLLMKGLEMVPDDEGTHMFEVEITGPDDRVYTFEVSAQQTEIGEGRVPGFFCVARNITDRKNYEASLMAVTNKLQLLSAVTRNDIKNQLSVLFGYIELSKYKKELPDIRLMTDKIEKTAKTILYQIEFTGDYQELGIKNAKWQDLLITFKYAISHLDMLPLKQVIDVQPVEIFVDPLFEKALCSIVGNSIVHGQHVTEIRLSTRETDKGLMVIYEDNGVGIPEKDKEMIFKHGFGKINGFGLFLTREILSITNVSIRETGEPGVGARFEIFIPMGKFRKIAKDS
ncbi:MAG: CHASE4 domain-containing protein [Methanomicrobiales archaeon]